MRKTRRRKTSNAGRTPAEDERSLTPVDDPEQLGAVAGGLGIDVTGSLTQIGPIVVQAGWNMDTHWNNSATLANR
jgi:hypothetical protein